MKKGYVWYGKLGSKISESTLPEILDSDSPKILLMSSSDMKNLINKSINANQIIVITTLKADGTDRLK